MGLLVEKKETKTDFEYRIKKKPWFIGWAIVLFILIVGFIYRMQNPWIFLAGVLIFFIWAIILFISFFSLTIAMFTPKTITKEGFLINVVWKTKK